MAYLNEIEVNGEVYNIKEKKTGGLAGVKVFILDLINDEVRCSHGAIDQIRRRVTT